MVRSFLVGVFILSFRLAYADQNTENDAWILLQKAALSAHTQDYQGIFTYQNGSKTKSVQIIHANLPHGEYARTQVLDGTPREILNHGEDIIIYHYQNEKVIIEKRHQKNTFPAILPRDIGGLKAAYQARLGGIERIGGREGQIIFLEARDQYRYGYKFWTDREFGLLLRSLMTNLHNEVLERITFNQLTFLNITNMDWFHPSISPGKEYCMEITESANKTRHEPEWTVSSLPAGFRKIDQTSHIMPGKSLPITHTIYSDGLVAVSLFVEPLNKGTPAKIGHWVTGATHIHAGVTNGYQIMVVGEVPEATTIEMANAVHFKQ